jgi:transcription antitermination factor NusG
MTDGSEACSLPGTDSTWYALMTRYHHEKKVDRFLGSFGVESFLPLCSETRPWKDGMKELQLPLFPCYVFVRFGSERRGVDVLTAPGVYDFVRFGGRPAPIASDEIEAVKRVVTSAAQFGPHPFIAQGDRVRVVAGPLSGIEGIAVRWKTGLRLVLSMALVQQSVAVEVDGWAVRRVESRPAAPAPPEHAAGGRAFNLVHQAPRQTFS